jgi:hypothetical protein
MSSPIPPSGPPPYQPPPGYGPPPGYSAFDQPQRPQGFSGMAIAGFVLALVGFIPCFWFWFQIPGLLGAIFSIVALGATKATNPAGAKRGRGLAVAGLVIGIVTLLITAAFTGYIYSTDDCVVDGLNVHCSFQDTNP